MGRRLIGLANRILRSRLASRLLSSARFTWELAGLSRGLAMEAVLRGVSGEEEFWRRGREDASRLSRFLDENSVVLDVGCGVGRVMRFAASMCREIHGVDLSRSMLRIARKNLLGLDNCFLHRGDARRLTMFPDNMFDLVYSFYTLQHMEKEDAYLSLREFYRVLKPKGIAYVQFPDLLSDCYFSLFEEYALKGCRYAARVRFYTKPEARRMLEGCGFRVLECTVEGENIFMVGLKPEKEKGGLKV